MRGRTAARLVALLWWATQAVAAPTGPAPHRAADPLGEHIDTLVADAGERPAAALGALQTLRFEHHGSSADAQRLLFAMAGIEARRSDGAGRATALANEMLALAPNDARTRAAADLVRALVADQAGQGETAATLAQAALPALMAGCPGAPAADSEPARACEHRAAWRALQLAQRHASNQGLPMIAAGLAEQGLGLAEWASDGRRRVLSLSALASIAGDHDEPARAQAYIDRARQLAVQRGDPAEQARVIGTEAQLAAVQGDAAGALRLYEAALALAVRAQAPRLEAMLLANVSDTCAHMGRHAEALGAAERALRIVRASDDRGSEAVLINNAGIARIGLGRVAEGKQDLARVLELWRQRGATSRQIASLREFGQALAAAGDARSALDLYHRERALNAELIATNRRIVQREMKARFEADARERDIELRGRDNALKTAALANRGLQQRIGWLLAAVMGTGMAVAATLYWRIRDVRRRLEASQRQLQARSERDPLTSLSNRRHFQSVMHQSCGIDGFEGVLLLVDIDHFKHVNDRHGHAIGDQVLLEVAQRLTESVRQGDLVVRWGGEEFLILAPHAPAERAEPLAERVLRSLGDHPVRVGDRHLVLTASIGYAHFPLPPFDAEVPWEQAVNLVDLALYAAKRQGRNRAIGITATKAMTLGALRDIESDFDQAGRDGRVTLQHTAGPRLPAAATPADALATPA